MDNNNLFIIWSIMIIAGLILDGLAYLVLRDQWRRSGLILTDELWAQVSSRLGQRVKTWQESLLVISKPSQTVLSRPTPPAPPPSQPARQQVIPASIKMVGQVRKVEFSMDMPLNTTVTVHIGANPEDGVKVEKSEL